MHARGQTLGVEFSQEIVKDAKKAGEGLAASSG
jgi:hypothetical protein